jgi:hypothetical protein
LHLPPSDTTGWKFRTSNLSHPTCLYRTHSNNRNPIGFSFSKWRFDAPNEVFGVCYFGINHECAFIETFLHEGYGSGMITDTSLNQSSLAVINLDHPLKLLDLTNNGAFLIGADQRISTTKNYAITRAWSLAIYQHQENFDGILYFSKNNNSQNSVAIFERAQHKISVLNSHGWLSKKYKDECFRILKEYGMEYCESDTPVSLND